MLDGRAESTLCGVADLYIVDFGGGEQERACHEAEREAERRRLADRYARYLVASAEVGQAASRRVLTALFDPRDADGEFGRRDDERLGAARFRTQAYEVVNVGGERLDDAGPSEGCEEPSEGEVVCARSHHARCDSSTNASYLPRTSAAYPAVVY